MQFIMVYYNQYLIYKDAENNNIHVCMKKLLPANEPSVYAEVLVCIYSFAYVNFASFLEF